MISHVPQFALATLLRRVLPALLAIFSSTLPANPIPLATYTTWVDTLVVDHANPFTHPDVRHYESGITSGETAITNTAYGAFAHGRSAIAPTPSPTLLSHSQAGGTVRADVTTETILTYYLRANSTTNSLAEVRVDADARVSVSAEGSGVATSRASLRIEGLFNNSYYDVINEAAYAEIGHTGPGSQFDSFGVHGSFFFQANLDYRIRLQTNSTATKNMDAGSGDATAFLDPLFTLVGPEAGLFTLELSPGIGNEAPVPSVPDNSASVGLLAVALAGLIAGRRRIVRG